MPADFCQLYNAGLEQRLAAYRRGRISVSYSVSYKMQANELKGVRGAAPELARWSFSAQQQVLRRLDKTFKAFFARGQGFPRFRARARYHAAVFRVGDGLRLRKSGKLGFVGVCGEVKVRWHRQLPSAPKSAILTRQADQWYIVFHVEVVAVERAGPDSVGVDFGLSNLIALSNRETVERPRWVTRAERELRRRQRQLARCKGTSKTRSKRKAALAKFQGRVAAKRRDHLHKVARNLVTRCERIGIEDLTIKGLAGGRLAKHVHDAAWAQLTAMLNYKAASAGVELVKVDPRGTSQTCPECGIVAAKTLAEREHRCQCGCVLDRDVAAVKVVHFKVFGFWQGAGRGSPSQRVAA